MIVEQQCWDLCIKHNNIAPGNEILKIETIAMPFFKPYETVFEACLVFGATYYYDELRFS